MPDKIIIWLSSDELNKADVPTDLFNDPLVEIKWVDKNLYVWKRFLTIQQYPEAYVLMMDDDFYYDIHYIEEMIKYAKKCNNKGIICYACNPCNTSGEPWGDVRGNEKSQYNWLSGGVTMWCT